MKNEFWKYIKKPEVIPFVIVLTLTLIVEGLGVFADIIDVKILVQAILLVLASIIASLLLSHKSTLELKEKLQGDLSIRDILFRHHTMRDELREKIPNAKEIWLLSRTGRNWWRSYFQGKYGLMKWNRQKDRPRRNPIMTL